MPSAEFNITSVTSLTLDGLMLLSEHSFFVFFFFFFLAIYIFVLFSDSLVVYVICSQRSLHRPMFAFVAAILLNSLAGSTVVYPKLLSDVLLSRGFVQVSRSACLGQAFVLFSLGGSSFMLLSAMAFDRYLSICRPLHYAALVSPAAVAALLLLCWLLPAGLVGGAVLLASRLPLCRSRISKIYCEVFSFVSLSCGGSAALLSDVYGLLCTFVLVFLPVVFVLFTYSRILSICLRRSRAFSSKALHTCLPHLLVFISYSLSVAVELLHRQLQAESETVTSIITSILMLVVPTVMNPVVYGLKMKEIFRQVKRLLGCQTAPSPESIS